MPEIRSPANANPMPAVDPVYLCEGALGFWQIAERQPSRIAITESNGGCSTFGELRDRVDRLSHALRGCGAKTGDAVAVLLPNSSDWLASALAISQIGAYLVPLNWHLTAEELAYLLSNSMSRVLIADHRFASTASQAARQAALPEQGRLAVAGDIPGFRDLQSLLDAQPDAPLGDRLAGSTMFYSSGTTGRPKGIRRPLTGLPPEGALARTLPLYSGMFGLRAGNGAHLVCTPLYHAAPGSRAIQMLHLGHRLVLLEKWDSERVLALIESERIDSVQLVPILFHRLLQLPQAIRQRYDLSSLRTVIHAAAPCPPETKRRMIEWLGPVLHEYYACSEGGGTYVGSDDWLRRPGTVGRRYPFSKLAILDEGGAELPAGEPGLIYMNDGFDFEYFNDPQKTRSVKRGDLFTAGDYGYLDEEHGSDLALASNKISKTETNLLLDLKFDRTFKVADWQVVPSVAVGYVQHLASRPVTVNSRLASVNIEQAATARQQGHLRTELALTMKYRAWQGSLSWQDSYQQEKGDKVSLNIGYRF